MRKIIDLLFLYIFLSCFTTIHVSSQVQQEWVRRYNGVGSSDEKGSSVRIDKYGNIVVVGTSVNSVVTLKYNALGTLLWNSILQGPYLTRINKSLALDTEANIYVNATGQGNNYDIYTIKYDKNGAQQWISVYSSSGYSSDMNVRIEVGNDGYVYMEGQIEPVQYVFKYLTIKYNPITGDTCWTRIFGGYGTGPFDMVLDKKCNVYVTGSDSGFATIKYDSSGMLVWVSSHVSGEPHAMCIDKLGNVYVTGEIYDEEMDCKTVKYDSSGTILWTRIYNNFGINHYDEAWSIAADDSSNIYITGYSEDVNYNDEYLIVKYNTNGVQQWAVHYTGIGQHSDWPEKIILDRNGYCYITGYTCYYGPNTRQYTTLKYSPSGNLIWAQNYRNINNGDDRADDLAIDSSLNVYVTGTSYGNGTGYDIATIKYSQLIGINPISSNYPDAYSLSQNYPNPFNPVTRIKFDITSNGKCETSNVKLVIYDILGREVATLVNEQLKPGSYEVEWDGSNYASGIYFYRLISDEFVENKKMVLIK